MQFELLERKAKVEPRFKMPAANFSVRMENQTKKLQLVSLNQFILMLHFVKKLDPMIFFSCFEIEGHLKVLAVELSRSEG